MRKIKLSPSGSGAKKKAYYLENAMQFCLPFIKTVMPHTTGNLPAPPSTTQPSNLDIHEFQSQVEDFTQLEVESTYLQQHSVPMSPSILNDPPKTPSETPSSYKRTSQRMKKTNKSSTSSADQSVAEYFNAKKAKLLSNSDQDTSNQKIDKQQGVKMFLLSLMPELEELSDSQIKLFKRKVLKMIDEISLSDQHQESRSSSGLTILTSPTMSNSRDSLMGATQMSNVVGEMHTADFYNAFSTSIHSTNM